MGRLLCEQTPLLPNPPALEPAPPCLASNGDTLERIGDLEPDEMNEAYAAYLLEVSEAGAEETSRGNGYLNDAITELAAMSTTFADDDLGGFVGAGARTLTALAECESAIDAAEGWLDQDGMSWSEEIGEVNAELTALKDELDGPVETEMIADIDGRLALDLETSLDGSAAERVGATRRIAQVHLAAGLELHGLADLLGDVDQVDARPIARELAKDYGAHTEEGTAHYYNEFMEDSDAAPALKGHFALALDIPLADTGNYFEYDDEDQACDLNEAGDLRALHEAREAQQAQAKKAIVDLGVMRDPLGGGFAKSAGKLAELLVTDDGEKAGLEVKVKLAIPMPSGIDATVSLKLAADLSRAGDQRALNASFEFMLGAELDAVIAKAFIEAGLIGKLKTSGDSFEESFKLVILALYDRMSQTSQGLADAAFSGDKMEAVSDNMDGDDTVEYSMGVKGAMGAEVGDGDHKKAAGASGEMLWGTKLTGGVGERDGLDVKRAATKTYAAKVEVALGKFGGSAKVEASVIDDKLDKIAFEAEAVATLPAEQLATELFAAGVVGQLVGTVGGAISKGKAAFDPSQPAHAQLASAAKEVAGVTGADALLKGKAADALDNAKMGGIDVAYKVTLAGEVGATGAPKLKATLSQETAIKREPNEGPLSVEGKATLSRELAKVELLK